jgi:hypothetical protein
MVRLSQKHRNRLEDIAYIVVPGSFLKKAQKSNYIFRKGEVEYARICEIGRLGVYGAGALGLAYMVAQVI